MYDLVADPAELHNLLFDDVEAWSPDVAQVFADLKAEIARLQQEYGDDGLYADPRTWPAGSADGPFEGKAPLGTKTVPEAIAAAAG